VGVERGGAAVAPAAVPLPGQAGVPAGRGIDAEQRFGALLESAPDAMVIADDTGTIRLVNAQTEALFGYPRQELLGRPVEILVPRRFRSGHRVHRRGYAASQQVRPMGAGLELHGLRRDGSEFPVEISLSPLQTRDGLLVSAAVRDVSGRKAAEERISELALIVESSQDAILTKTLDGVITFWNAAAARMYGYTAEEAVGRHVSMLAPPGHEAEIAELLARMGRGERVDHYEALRVTRAGDLLDVDILVCPVRTHDGAISGACAIARDISEHKHARQELTRLYQQQRHIALTLQRALMGSPPPIPGIETASRYRPATRGAGVGGDWFDLIPLGAGRVGVLIGDVMGRGLPAATVMGQLRSAANALARTGMPPQQLMHALDAVVCDLPGQLITCCYLIIDATRGEVTATSAGHLPVLLVQPGATVGQLPIPVSVPLGVGGIAHQETTLPVPHRSVLVLYTDGLVETHSSDLGTQIKALESELRAVFAATSSLEQAADHVLAALLPGSGEPADDVTLLLARTPTAPLASAQTTLRPEPRQVAAGRQFTRQALTAWQQAELAHTACLLVSEILTNAVQHARQSISLRLHHTAREIIAEITDDNPQLPQRTRPDPASETGRGLTLVDALAATWGARPAGAGKTVWFTLTSDTEPKNPSP
jgi:PAS domain S-box-containing protein